MPISSEAPAATPNEIYKRSAIEHLMASGELKNNRLSPYQRNRLALWQDILVARGLRRESAKLLMGGTMIKAILPFVGGGVWRVDYTREELHYTDLWSEAPFFAPGAALAPLFKAIRSNNLRIPFGRGTIGNVIEHADKIDAGGAGYIAADSVADLRGAVAMEDLILGHINVLLVPIFPMTQPSKRDVRLLLSLFLPVPGIFTSEFAKSFVRQVARPLGQVLLTENERGIYKQFAQRAGKATQHNFYERLEQVMGLRKNPASPRGRQGTPRSDQYRIPFVGLLRTDVVPDPIEAARNEKRPVLNGRLESASFVNMRSLALASQMQQSVSEGRKDGIADAIMPLEVNLGTGTLRAAEIRFHYSAVLAARNQDKSIDAISASSPAWRGPFSKLIGHVRKGVVAHPVCRKLAMEFETRLLRTLVTQQWFGGKKIVASKDGTDSLEVLQSLFGVIAPHFLESSAVEPSNNAFQHAVKAFAQQPSPRTDLTRRCLGFSIWIYAPAAVQKVGKRKSQGVDSDACQLQIALTHVYGAKRQQKRIQFDRDQNWQSDVPHKMWGRPSFAFADRAREFPKSVNLNVKGDIIQVALDQRVRSRWRIQSGQPVIAATWTSPDDACLQAHLGALQDAACNDCAKELATYEPLVGIRGQHPRLEFHREKGNTWRAGDPSGKKVWPLVNCLAKTEMASLAQVHCLPVQLLDHVYAWVILGFRYNATANMLPLRDFVLNQIEYEIGRVAREEEASQLRSAYSLTHERNDIEHQFGSRMETIAGFLRQVKAGLQNRIVSGDPVPNDISRPLQRCEDVANQLGYLSRLWGSLGVGRTLRESISNVVNALPPRLTAKAADRSIIEQINHACHTLRQDLDEMPKVRWAASGDTARAVAFLILDLLANALEHSEYACNTHITYDKATGCLSLTSRYSHSGQLKVSKLSELALLANCSLAVEASEVPREIRGMKNIYTWARRGRVGVHIDHLAKDQRVVVKLFLSHLLRGGRRRA